MITSMKKTTALLLPHILDERHMFIAENPLTHFTVSNRCLFIYIVINSSSSSVYSAYRNLSVWSY
jgi:hypothetical protein